MFRQLGNIGIPILTQYFVVDFIFIASLAYIQLSIQHWILGEKLMKTKLRFLNIVPYARGIFDLAENVLFLYLIQKMTTEIKELVPVMSFVTQMKYIIIGIWFAVLTVACIARILAVKHGRNKLNSNNKFGEGKEWEGLVFIFFLEQGIRK